MDVYLVRHAIAAQRDEERWPDDRDRPLTPKGIQRFRRAARGLGAIVPQVDLVFSSPLERAWRTAVILREEVRWPEPAAWPQLEPDRSPQQVVLALGPHASRAAVALVGHEPSLSTLLAFLAAGSPDAFQTELKKGGVACLSVEGRPRAGNATLHWLLTPRMLRALT
jgi:phosphohistidine phosphatase